MTEMLLTLPKLQACLVLAEVAVGNIHLVPVKAGFEGAPDHRWKISVPAGVIYIEESFRTSAPQRAYRTSTPDVFVSMDVGPKTKCPTFVIDVSECYNVKAIPQDILTVSQSVRNLTDSLLKISRLLNTDPTQNLENEHAQMYKEKIDFAEYLNGQWDSLFPGREDKPELAHVVSNTYYYAKRAIDLSHWRAQDLEGQLNEMKGQKSAEKVSEGFKAKVKRFFSRLYSYL